MTEMISIIVPVYNIAAYLPRCLDSILSQTYENIEIITVNDGSTDESGKILDEYAKKDSRVTVIHQENGGVTKARFAGIRAAKGDYIGFCDGDDYIEPDMYERLLKNAEDHGADISHCGYRMVFSDGRISFFHNSKVMKLQDTNEGLRDLLDGSLVEPGLWNKLFKRELFDEMNCDTSIRINEDLLMNYILFSRSKRSVFDDFCPYHYIVRSTSASRSPLNMHRIWDPICVKEMIMDMSVVGMEDAAQRAYMSTCINVYSGLMLGKDRSFLSEEVKIRDILIAHKEWICLLGKKQRLLARLILIVPGLYRYLYRFYARFILKNPYQ